MLYIIAIGMGILLGWLAGGKIINLADLKFEKAWLVVVAFLIQTTAQILGVRGFAFISDYSMILQGIVFCLLLIGFWYNRKYIGIWFIAAGCLINALVMMLNGGKMPVDVNIMKKLGAAPEIIEQVKMGIDGKHTIITESTRLVFLSDIMSPPPVLNWLMKIISIGDIIVLFGLFVLIFEAVNKKTTLNKPGGFKSA